ncbi:MAG: ATP-binding cassette domain-containing protein [Synergistaceae bacterium]|nr:ATP-binding cassette domain-containing protein [Synergistaceae bacterium]
MIKLRNINKTYKTSTGPLKALDAVSVDIAAGRIFGFIGLSGAGKSTLLRCVNLLERPDEGQVLIEGEDFTSLPYGELLKRRRKIGMIFQHYNLLSNSTVYDNVAFPLVVARLPRTEVRDRVKRSLDTVDLPEKAGDYPAKLSGGQKQRVAIARAIAMNPKILLCDEPTSALDPHTTSVVLQYLKRVNEDLGITIVLVTHEMEAAKMICDSVSVLERGRLVETFDMTDETFAPQSDIAKHLFGNGAGI